VLNCLSVCLQDGLSGSRPEEEVQVAAVRALGRLLLHGGAECDRRGTTEALLAMLLTAYVTVPSAELQGLRAVCAPTKSHSVTSPPEREFCGSVWQLHDRHAHTHALQSR
jgi:hypothetical protein